MAQESRLAITVDSTRARVSANDLEKALRGLDDVGVRVTSTTKNVSKQVGELASSTDVAAASIKRGLISAIGGLSAMRLIDVADEWGQVASRIKMATQSSEEYDLVQKRMVSSANATYRNINETRESFIQLSPVLRQMGMSLNESMDAIDAFSGLMVTNAASTDRGAAAMRALSISLQKGKMDAMSWMTIYSTLDSIVDTIAAHSGLAAEEIRKLGASGQLSVEIVAKALAGQVEQVMAQVDEMPTTVRDAMGKIANEFTNYIGLHNEATGATAALASGVELVGENLSDILTVALVSVTAVLTKYSLAMAANGVQMTSRTIQSVAAAAEELKLAKAHAAASLAALDQAKSNAVLGGSHAAVAKATDLHTAAQARLLQAQTAAKSITSGLLGVMTGPAGIAIAAGLAATAFMSLTSETRAAKKTLDEMLGPIDSVVAGFKELSRVGQENELINQTKAVKLAASEADDAFSLLSTRVESLALSDSGFGVRSLGDIHEFIASLEDALNKGEAIQPMFEEFGAKFNVKQSTIETWMSLSASFMKAKKEANEASDVLDTLKNVLNGIETASIKVGAAISSASSVGMDKWDEYLKKLTDARDMIGMNAGQLGDFQARQAGANEVQAKMAGLVSAEADEFRNLQQAIKDKDKVAEAAAIDNIKNIDLEIQRVALLAQQVASVIAIVDALRNGAISQGAYTVAIRSVNEAYEGLAGDLALSEEAQKVIDNIRNNTTPSKAKGGSSSPSNPGADYIKSLKERIALLGATTEHEQLLAQITSGALTFQTAQQKELALAMAQTFDKKQRQIELEETLRDLRLQQGTTERQFMLELSSMGRGDNFREMAQGLAQVEERYRGIIEQRRNSPHGLSDNELEQTQESLNRELEITRKFYEDKKALESDWRLGLSEGLNSYADEVANVYESVGSLVSSSFKGMEDALVNFVKTGKADFKSLANSIIADMARIAIQQSITGPLASALGGIFSGGGASFSGGWGGASMSSLPMGFADGGQIVGPGTGTSDSILARVSNGEFVINAESTRRHYDLIRAINDGSLDRVRKYATGGLVGSASVTSSPSVPQSGNIQINVINNSSQPVQAQANTRFDGEQAVIEIVLKDLHQNGQIAQTMKYMQGA